MRKLLFCLLGACLLPGAAAARATRPGAPNAYLAPMAHLTLVASLELAARARAKAATLNQQVSVAVAGANGRTSLLTQGNGAGPRNTKAARHKAHTAFSAKTPTLLPSSNARASPNAQRLGQPAQAAANGGVPVRHQDQVEAARRWPPGPALRMQGKF